MTTLEIKKKHQEIIEGRKFDEEEHKHQKLSLAYFLKRGPKVNKQALGGEPREQQDRMLSKE